MKEAHVARGFYPVVVPILSDKPTGRGKGDSSSVKNVCGKTGRGKGGRGSKGSGSPFALVMVHRVLKVLSSAVRMIVGRVVAQRWMLARRI